MTWRELVWMKLTRAICYGESEDAYYWTRILCDNYKPHVWRP